MNELTEILKVVKEKFPGQSARIDKLYEENEDFRSLCLDYFSSLLELKNFYTSSEESNRSIEDYKNVIEDLEKEFGNFIFSRL